MKQTEKNKFKVTPWEVSGSVDYNKLVKEFGVKLIDDKILKRIEKHTGELHIFLRRRIFFAHRDLDWILDKFEENEKFFLYTGRGPSGKTHIGHLIPWIFTKWLQDKFDAELYFQITNDEKFLVKEEEIENIKKYTEENLKDIAAIGFDPKKTFIIRDIEDIDILYELAIKISKHITFSTMKAIFGFKDSTNVGLIFFPSIQAAPCFLPSFLKGKNIPCLIPAAIDQDPYWRGVARYVAPKLNFYKPAQIHCKFLPGLLGDKMSSSIPDSCIFTTDSPEEVRRKIWKAFTGGRGTLKEQKEKGGNPDVCIVYKYLYYFFEDDDKEIMNIYNKCKSGDIYCGYCKEILTKKVNEFLKKYREMREKTNVKNYIRSIK
jgi:tryptophanyl-tRNA synthetase